LSKDKNPKDEDLRAISSYLSQLEDSTDLQSDAIRETKIRRALMEVLELEIVPGRSEFNFRARFKRLLKRYNKAFEHEKIQDNTEQPAGPPKNSADEDGGRAAEAKGSTSDTRTGKAYFQYSLAVLTFLCQ
jgi:hypothetical protein